MATPLRIVVINSDLLVHDPLDTHALQQAERSRSLRIGLLESGFNLVASLPADVYLTERLASSSPTSSSWTLKAMRATHWSTW